MEKKLPVNKTETEREEPGGCSVLECTRVRTFRKASDHTVKQSRTALMISGKLDCRGPRKGRRWRHRDREMSEKSGWELKVGVEWK